MNEPYTSTKCQSVLWATIAIDLQEHCTCYLHLQLMGSTAVVFTYHRTPYVHLSMSYSGFSSALSLTYRMLYFSELSKTCFLLHATGLEEWDEFLGG